MKKTSGVGPCPRRANNSDTGGGATVRTTPKNEEGALRVLSLQKFSKYWDDREALEARRRQKARAKITLPHVSIQDDQ